MTNTELGGHSGCKIILYDDDTHGAFVRKISSSIGYNERLQTQKEKQEKFQNDIIKVPRIIKDGYLKTGLYYFDMEYVHGITMAEYIKEVEVSEIKGIVEKLFKAVMDQKALSSTITNRKVSKIAFEAKIDSLQSKLCSLKNPIIDDALHMLTTHNWNKVVNSSCHGDMTMENIIVRNNNLYLIDFLDSFYDSLFFDLSTLLQDAELLWHYRNEKVDNNTIIRLIIMRDLLVNKMKSIMKEDYIEVYYILLLKLIRIYPYTRDELTYDFLNKKTKLLMDFINSNKDRG